jgi:N-methylhydantoinase A
VCYDQGGEEPTVTDANLVLGYLNPEFFAGRDVPLNSQKALRAIEDRIARHLRMDPYRAARGVVDISSHNITQLINEISTEQGHDPREFALIAFGGAGPVQAGIVAEALGIRTVIVPLYPGVLSALGMLLVDPRYDFVQSCLVPLDSIDLGKINTIFESMKKRGLESLERAGYREPFQVENFMDMRFYKQNFEVITPVPRAPLSQEDLQRVSQNFHEEYKKLYGHIDYEEPIEIVNLRTSVSHRREREIRLAGGVNRQQDLDRALKGRRRVYFEKMGGFVDCPIYDRDALPREVALPSPAIIEELGATTVVYPDQEGRLDNMGNIIISLS